MLTSMLFFMLKDNYLLAPNQLRLIINNCGNISLLLFKYNHLRLFNSDCFHHGYEYLYQNPHLFTVGIYKKCYALCALLNGFPFTG